MKKHQYGKAVELAVIISLFLFVSTLIVLIFISCPKKQTPALVQVQDTETGRYYVLTMDEDGTLVVGHTLIVYPTNNADIVSTKSGHEFICSYVPPINY